MNGGSGRLRKLAMISVAAGTALGVVPLIPAKAASSTQLNFGTYMDNPLPCAAPFSGQGCPNAGYVWTGVAVSSSPVETWTLQVIYPYGCAPPGTIGGDFCSGTWVLTGRARDSLSGTWGSYLSCYNFSVTGTGGRFSGGTISGGDEPEWPYLLGQPDCRVNPANGPNGLVLVGLLQFTDTK